MITYKSHILPNGLVVIAHRDASTPMAAVNLIYRVGARNEDPSRTGFAHLFEHLMFGGTSAVPNFDEPVQLACGENNAFTNNDYTDYYIVLPKANIETAFWLESDRMQHLNINYDTLAIQQKVVVEEYNQRYLNKPYGDVWMLLRELAFKEHPYRWATIGRTPEHICEASLEDVKAFYERYYNPSNAILSVAADIPEEEVFRLAEKWFGDVPANRQPKDMIPQEPEQTVPRRMEVRRKVPATVIYIAFHKSSRLSREFHVCDMISDLLSSGTSSRMYQELVKEQQLFTGVNAYVTGDLDPGLFVLTGTLAEHTGLQEAEQALWQQLELLKTLPVELYELEKVKNKFEANTIFGEINVMNKAMNLGYYEMAGDLSLINKETEIYRSVEAREIMETAARIFTKENSSTLIYEKE